MDKKREPYDGRCMYDWGGEQQCNDVATCCSEHTQQLAVDFEAHESKGLRQKIAELEAEIKTECSRRRQAQAKLDREREINLELRNRLAEYTAADADG